tara:strand:- start:515 stop:868 length:354 start_codon:yes stop_codon:yes gene_type:complete
MKLDNKILAGVCILIVLGLVLKLFGFIGVRSIVGMFVLFIVPVFMILNNFDLEMDEKIFFSLFFGLSLFSLFIWLVDRIIPSLRFSIVVAFILCVGGGIYLGKRLHKKKSQERAKAE